MIWNERKIIVNMVLIEAFYGHKKSTLTDGIGPCREIEFPMVGDFELKNGDLGLAHIFVIFS